MHEHEGTREQPEYQDLDAGGLAHGNAMGVGKIGGPGRSGALGVGGNLRHAVERIPARRGQAQIASAALQLGSPGPHTG